MSPPTARIPQLADAEIQAGGVMAMEPLKKNGSGEDAATTTRHAGLAERCYEAVGRLTLGRRFRVAATFSAHQINSSLTFCILFRAMAGRGDGRAAATALTLTAVSYYCAPFEATRAYLFWQTDYFFCFRVFVWRRRMRQCIVGVGVSSRASSERGSGGSEMPQTCKGS